MISKLPKWVWLGGSILALIAGMINAVGFLGFQHQGVTHLTGTTTLVGIAIAGGHGFQAFHLLMVILSFLSGAVFSGFLIQDSTLRLGRRYGVALMVESVLLFAAVPLLSRHKELGAYLASFACGLQNAMASTYSGAVLRTTHVSGAFTDIGILLGHWIRGLEIDARRLQFCLMQTGAFFIGSLAGAAAFASLGYDTLLIPALLTGLTGFAYALYRHRVMHLS
jgi:uncharacterized membrane protein YoaK (UPF0700 family)